MTRCISPKSVSNTWWLTALIMWWLEPTSPPTTLCTLHGADAGPPPRPRNLETRSSQCLSPRPPKVLRSFDRPESVSSTRWLAALKWWLKSASLPNTTSDARIMVTTVRCRAPARPQKEPHHSMTLRPTSKGASELTPCQIRVSSKQCLMSLKRLEPASLPTNQYSLPLLTVAARNLETLPRMTLHTTSKGASKH